MEPTSVQDRQSTAPGNEGEGIAKGVRDRERAAGVRPSGCCVVGEPFNQYFQRQRDRIKAGDRTVPMPFHPDGSVRGSTFSFRVLAVKSNMLIPRSSFEAAKLQSRPTLSGR